MEPEAVWELYQAGIEYKYGIDLFETVDRNERFFAGDQWAGVNAPDLPKPVVNFIKRACQQRIAEVKANPVKVFFSALEYPEGAAGGEFDCVTDRETQLLNAVFESDWERLKMDYVNLDGLQDACISGDYILYSYWDAAGQTGQTARGRICVETIDNVNYYPGNPNEREVQKQPYIILARRELCENVRAQAKAGGIPGAEIALIGADISTEQQSGDLSKKELDDGNGKCVTLLYLWKDTRTGHVFAQKTARGAFVRKAWDTRLTRYPLALMNWELRKNCCHGRAEITGLVPVQRYINQMYAMAMLFTMQSACPKPVYNQGMVKAWSTAVGAAIPVNGDINAAAKYLEPPSLPGDAYDLPERLMDKTLEMLGVSNIELGNVNPTNMSAMTLARKASTIPIETIQSRFYSMLEDFARNWLDMVIAFETVPRWETVEHGKKAVLFDTASLRQKLWSVKIDVGAAELWSEIASAQTLRSLLDAGVIDARQYIERLPGGSLPMREKLLAELKDGKTNEPKSSRDE